MDEKHNLLEVLRKFWKLFLRKLLKMHYFCLFYTKVYTPCVNFSRVWTKNTNCWKSFEKSMKILDENSIEILTFKLFLEMLMLKIEPSEITSFFYNNFFQFRGWNVPGVPPPGYATDSELTCYLLPYSITRIVKLKWLLN